MGLVRIENKMMIVNIRRTSNQELFHEVKSRVSGLLFFIGHVFPRVPADSLITFYLF